MIGLNVVNYEINKSIDEKIRRLSFSGKSAKELKDLYIKRNCFGLSLDIDLYRIFNFDYFLEDVNKGVITLPKVSHELFDHDLENPIRDVVFKDGDDEKFKLGFLESYYGQSWTERRSESRYHWEQFSNGGIGVRAKVNLKKLMEQFVNTDDEFFMLHYFAGRINYVPRKDIEQWQKNCDYLNFLDSRGDMAVCSLLTLGDELDDEQEIRLIYNHMTDNQYTSSNVKVVGDVCKLPFNWSLVLEEVLYDSKMNKISINKLKSTLNSSGVSCPITISQV